MNGTPFRLIFAMTLLYSAAGVALDAAGESGGLKTFSAPDAAPRNNTFAVRVREAGGTWVDLFTYDAMVDEDKKGHMSFVYFDSDFVKPAEMEVRKKDGKIDSVRIRPASAKVSAKTGTNVITFTLVGPAKLSVEVNGDTHNNLMIFANPREEKPVTESGPGIHFFGPGVHMIGNDGRGTLKPADGDTVYIAGGAIVYGNIEAKGVKNVTIRGRGILCGSKFNHKVPDNQPKPSMIKMLNVTGARLEGITLLDTVGWNVLFFSCTGVRVGNVKIIGWTTNSDGVNPVDSTDVVIDGCFIRNHDDCFSIKLRHKAPDAAIGGCRNITIQNCVLWADKGRSFLIGPESSGKGPREYANITFRNTDILRVRNWTVDWAMGALAINCGDGSTVKDVLIEDVRVEGIENACPINFRIVKTPFNDDAGSRIENVTVRNVSLSGKNAVGNAIVGLDAERCIDGVRFQNLRINGKVVRSAADGGFTIRNARNVTFDR